MIEAVVITLGIVFGLISLEGAWHCAKVGEFLMLLILVILAGCSFWAGYYTLMSTGVIG